MLPEPGVSYIYIDQNGNKLVDFSRGIGPIGATLGLVVDLNETWRSVRGFISVEVSENQTLALSSFALGIGTEAFKRSNVLQVLNQGKYSEVPRFMRGWVLLPPEPGAEPVRNAGLVERRRFEASLFQTPDAAFSSQQINFGTETNFGELADQLDVIRAEYFANLTGG
jgi:hypothetical protein